MRQSRVLLSHSNPLDGAVGQDVLGVVRGQELSFRILPKFSDRCSPTTKLLFKECLEFLKRDYLRNAPVVSAAVFSGRVNQQLVQGYGTSRTAVLQLGPNVIAVACVVSVPFQCARSGNGSPSTALVHLLLNCLSDAASSIAGHSHTLACVVPEAARFWESMGYQPAKLKAVELPHSVMTAITAAGTYCLGGSTKVWVAETKLNNTRQNPESRTRLLEKAIALLTPIREQEGRNVIPNHKEEEEEEEEEGANAQQCTQQCTRLKPSTLQAAKTVRRGSGGAAAVELALEVNGSSLSNGLGARGKRAREPAGKLEELPGEQAGEPTCKLAESQGKQARGPTGKFAFSPKLSVSEIRPTCSAATSSLAKSVANRHNSMGGSTCVVDSTPLRISKGQSKSNAVSSATADGKRPHSNSDCMGIGEKERVGAPRSSGREAYNCHGDKLHKDSGKEANNSLRVQLPLHINSSAMGASTKEGQVKGGMISVGQVGSPCVSIFTAGREEENPRGDQTLQSSLPHFLASVVDEGEGASGATLAGLGSKSKPKKACGGKEGLGGDQSLRSSLSRFPPWLDAATLSRFHTGAVDEGEGASKASLDRRRSNINSSIQKSSSKGTSTRASCLTSADEDRGLLEPPSKIPRDLAGDRAVHSLYKDTTPPPTYPPTHLPLAHGHQAEGRSPRNEVGPTKKKLQASGPTRKALQALELPQKVLEASGPIQKVLNEVAAATGSPHRAAAATGAADLDVEPACVGVKVASFSSSSLFGVPEQMPSTFSTPPSQSRLREHEQQARRREIVQQEDKPLSTSEHLGREVAGWVAGIMSQLEQLTSEQEQREVLGQIQSMRWSSSSKEVPLIASMSHASAEDLTLTRSPGPARVTTNAKLVASALFLS
eukprot:gene22267-29340_t